MTNVWCVRAEAYEYTEQFIDGGYIAIGWMPDTDLSSVQDREELYPLYREAHPEDEKSVVVGQQVGQIARFLFEIQPGDYVITPATDMESLHYGIVKAKPPYIYAPEDDTCPFPHRRPIDWKKDLILRGDLSVPFQSTIRSSLTVFSISHREEFLEAIGIEKRTPTRAKIDPYEVVLNQVLELDPTEFEQLVGHLLTALGFEGSEVIGKTGDGGVDVIGEVNAANLAKVKLYVQAKRYKRGTKVSAGVVRQLRMAIPGGGQGAFITTADYQARASEVALEPGFPRIGLINGRQLVDLLIKHWADIPSEFQDRLGLEPGLVLM